MQVNWVEISSRVLRVAYLSKQMKKEYLFYSTLWSFEPDPLISGEQSSPMHSNQISLMLQGDVGAGTQTFDQTGCIYAFIFALQRKH